MKANEANFLDFLRKSSQFAIPIYQRTYSWTERECRQLWEDVLRAGSNDNITAHFVGAIVHIEEGDSTPTNPTPLLVIDGQQRLTTVTLLIAALASTLDQMGGAEYEPVDGFSPIKLRSYYLLNPLEKGARKFKLILTQTDRDSLIAAVSGREQPKEPSLRITQNLGLFSAWISARKGEVSAVCKGLGKLAMVDIRLNRRDDNPQLIFESMNSTGRELTQADLIRNYVLMGLEPDLQTRLYEQYWRPIELDFGQEAYGTDFDSFMRHYLTVKTGEIPNVREVYEGFKGHASSPKSKQAGVETLVADIRTFARYYCAMALGQETDPDLRLAFQDLRDLKVDVAYPFLLELYHDYRTDALSREDLVAAVRLVESYVFRRSVCDIPTNSLNKTFATFSKAVRRDRYLESIQAHFLLLPSYRRFPTDEEFERNLQSHDLYNFSRRSYWLRRLENWDRKERVGVGDYTIEHILPKNPNLSSAWRVALGDDWQDVQKTWVHTLGNLTLTGYNSEYSDKSFAEKRDHPKGFKTSPLRLNEGLGQLTEWNETTIRDRAAKLAGLARQVWSRPSLASEVLATYEPGGHPEGYSIEDHPQLLAPALRDVFQAFRREVHALDPCVTEEFLKYYVAYKAETNFVDVVPQAKRMLLTLNMSFHDLDDPKGRAVDVSGKGRWGNGDVQIALDSPDEIPYVMGLVRQALEQQLGSNAVQ